MTGYLNEKEERELREKIRHELIEIENKKAEMEGSGKNLDSHVLEVEKKRIKNEEIEKFYTEKGYKKYINHYGMTEWLLPDEFNRRMARKEKSLKRKNSSKKKQMLNTILLMVIIVILVMVIGVIIIKYTNVVTSR